MIRSHSIVQTGVNVVATTTASTVQIPFDSSAGRPRYIRIASTAAAYVKVGNSDVVAVAGDLLVQPADSVMLIAAGCNYISVLALTGTCSVSIAPTDDGRWDSASPDALDVLRYYGSNAHIYLPGVGMLNGLQAGNYLDSAGTTVGTVDQPVGLVLDAAGGLGVEAYTDVEFNTPSAWTAQTNWAVSGGIATATGAASASSIYPSTGSQKIIAGKMYLVTVVCSSYTAGSWTVMFEGGGINLGSKSASGTFQGYLTANVSGQFYLWSLGGLTASFESISVREVTGIAASQPTTASKPILRRGAVNLVGYSNDVANTYWTKNNIVSPVAGFSDPWGGTSAQKVAANAVSTSHYFSPSTGTFPGANVTCTYAVVAKMAEETVLGIGIAGGTAFSATFNLSNGTTVANNVTSEIRAIGNGFYLCVMVGTPTAYANSPYLSIRATQTTFIGDGVSGLILAGIALFAGNLTAAQIQALGGIPLTTTAPASTALGPQYWSFDGSNDSLSLGSVPWTATDDHCVIAGVRSDAGGTERYVFGVSGASAANPLFPLLTWGSDNNLKAYWRNDAGSLVQAGNLASSLSVGTTYVVAAVKTGDSKTLWLNGALRAGDATGATGAATLTHAMVGSLAISSGAAAGFLTGSIYPVIAIKGPLPVADMLLLKKLVANLSGVTL